MKFKNKSSTPSLKQGATKNSSRTSLLNSLATLKDSRRALSRASRLKTRRPIKSAKKWKCCIETTRRSKVRFRVRLGRPLSNAVPSFRRNWRLWRRRTRKESMNCRAAWVSWLKSSSSRLQRALQNTCGLRQYIRLRHLRARMNRSCCSSKRLLMSSLRNWAIKWWSLAFYRPVSTAWRTNPTIEESSMILTQCKWCSQRFLREMEILKTKSELVRTRSVPVKTPRSKQMLPKIKKPKIRHQKAVKLKNGVRQLSLRPKKTLMMQMRRSCNSAEKIKSIMKFLKPQLSV